MKMTEELNAKIDLLETEVTDLKQKVNEIVACLEDNELSRKVSVDYLYPEVEATEEEEAKEKPAEEPEVEATEEPEVKPSK